MTRPVGITIGDPAGIGPELVARALADAWPAPLRVYGDRGVLARAARVTGASPHWDEVELVEVSTLGDLTPGRPSPAGGQAQVAYLEAALADARSGALAALCTAPIHKAAARAAGLVFPGHTELLAARLSDRPDGAPLPVTMMLAGPRLRVALVTTHLPLREVPAVLARDDGAEVVRAIEHAAEGLSSIFGVPHPRVGVAGLIPHAGESGLFGDEEGRLILPAIERARQRLGERATVSGPGVPDAIFREAVDGQYDAVVALYHDQGLIPVKLVDFDEAVNLTLGLPLVRTSPDHGVAYDLAGTGRARGTSFEAALRLACQAATR
jgi:4-hydroxythreonine-4-phosphate dehydrogenase